MSANDTNQYYCDVMTIGSGLILYAGRFRVDGTSSPDRVVDERDNTVGTLVTYENTGKTFTVTLPKVGGGWPQELISLIPKVAVLAATDTGDVDYVVDSYNPATGTFTLVGSVANVASVLTDNTEVHFMGMFRKDKILGQTV